MAQDFLTLTPLTFGARSFFSVELYSVEQQVRGCVHAKLLQSCLTLCDPMDCSCQSPLSMRLSRQAYWSGLPLPSPGDLPDPGIIPVSLMSPVLAGGFFTTSTIWWRSNGTHSSTVAWRIPWTEEPGGLQSMGSLRVGHD